MATITVIIVIVGSIVGLISAYYIWYGEIKEFENPKENEDE